MREFTALASGLMGLACDLRATSPALFALARRVHTTIAGVFNLIFPGYPGA